VTNVRYTLPRRPSSVTWLAVTPEAVVDIRDRANGTGEPLADALLGDPTRLVELFREAAVEAIRRDAPVGVAEELLVATRLAEIGARRFDADGHVARTLSSLRGSRDRSEIVPLLMAAAADASSSRDRYLLENLVGLAEAVPAELPDVGPSAILDVVDNLLPTEGAFSGTIVPDPPPPLPSPPPGRGEGEVVTDGTVTTPDEGTDERPVEPPPPPRDYGAELGHAIGAEIVEHFGVPGAIEVGEQLGSDFADAPDPPDKVEEWSALGKLIGSALGVGIASTVGAAVCSAIGGIIASAFGLAHLGGGGRDVVIDETSAAACVLCGPTCIACMLPAESLLRGIVTTTVPE
jgi:hypothetical protein